MKCIKSLAQCTVYSPIFVAYSQNLPRSILPRITANEIPPFAPPTVSCHDGSSFALFLAAAPCPVGGRSGVGAKTCRSHTKDSELVGFGGIVIRVYDKSMGGSFSLGSG